MDEIPHFIACDLSRIPPFIPDATNFYSLAVSVEFLHGQVSDLQKQLSTHIHRSVHEPAKSLRLDNEVDADKSRNAPQQQLLQTEAARSDTQVTESSATARPSYASAACTEMNNMSLPKARARLYGAKKVNNVELKTVPWCLTAFVVRLHEDTTSDDLTSFLEESGLQGVRCIKFRPPSGRIFRTAAFCVSCPAEGNEHLFYSDDVWPESAELRDWYFKQKSSTKDENETIQNSRHGT